MYHRVPFGLRRVPHPPDRLRPRNEWASLKFGHFTSGSQRLCPERQSALPFVSYYPLPLLCVSPLPRIRIFCLGSVMGTLLSYKYLFQNNKTLIANSFFKSDTFWRIRGAQARCSWQGSRATPGRGHGAPLAEVRLLFFPSVELASFR